MKNKLLITAAFWLCILGPNLLFPFVKNEADEGTGEKRNLAAFPVFSLETVDTFPSSVESYINDHAAFRNRFLTLNSFLNLKLFNYADSLDVIKGKDGWYFYSAGTSVEDFLGINRFSEEDLSLITERLQTASDYCEEQGIEFIVLLAPNKENVYSEYLPGGYERVDSPTRREQLIDCLRQNSTVNVVDPFPYLAENRDYQWYFKTDTHWNDAAGFIAGQMLIEAAGGTPTPISEVQVDYVPREMGDLANLFHMPERYNEEEKAVISGYHDELEIRFEDRKGDGNIVHLTTPKAQDPRRIAVYRDSFGTALMSALPKYFQHTDFYHWQAFDAELLREKKPDILVYELVEREQGRIAENVMQLVPDAFNEGE